MAVRPARLTAFVKGAVVRITPPQSWFPGFSRFMQGKKSWCDCWFPEGSMIDLADIEVNKLGKIPFLV